MYVIDASVLVADVRPSEPFHTESHTFLTYLVTERKIAYLPTIILAEVAAAISRGIGDSVLAQRLVSKIQQLKIYHFVSIDKELGQLAAILATENKIRGCDAIYVALAENYNVPIITLDNQQKTRVPSHIIARTPIEELANLNL